MSLPLVGSEAMVQLGLQYAQFPSLAPHHFRNPHGSTTTTDEKSSNSSAGNFESFNYTPPVDARFLPYS